MPEEYHTFENVGTAVAVALRMIADGDASTFVVVPEGDRYAVEVLDDDGLTVRRV